MINLPQVKLGIVAVSRNCFPMSLSESRRKAVVAAYQGEIYECPTVVESEIHMKKALKELKEAGCNSLVVYLGNFGPESAETLLAKYFDGPVMYVAAAEETGNNLVGGRGDAYCGMLNATLPEEVTQGTLEGDIIPGDITFFRLQSTSDAKLRAYIAQGEVLPVATRSFGAIGIFAIPEMGRFYRHVLIEKNFPHHGAVAFGHFGKTIYEVFKYIGVEVEEIGYNQPKGVRYPTENPFKR